MAMVHCDRVVTPGAVVHVAMPSLGVVDWEAMKRLVAVARWVMWSFLAGVVQQAVLLENRKVSSWMWVEVLVVVLVPPMMLKKKKKKKKKKLQREW